MKIDNQMKYDFCDLLLRPKRSSLSSRSEVSLEREFTFKYSKRNWKGIPIIASNMDTVGTFEMYDALSKHKYIVAFHKFYTLQDYIDRKSTLDPNYYSLTTGIREEAWIKTKEVIKELNPYFLTIDVANGYSTKLVEFCRMVREEYPELTIIAGNVATYDMVQELILYAKVDIVKMWYRKWCFVYYEN